MHPTVVIESLDSEGRGIARVDGKALFVEGALPGEQARVEVTRRKPSYEQGRAVSIARPNPSRVVPRCPHFGVCGGCTLQHADAPLQVAAKQRVLEDALARLGRVKPGRILPPIYGPTWHYRHRARLSVRNVPKKGGVLVGFHERRSSYVADMRECHVVPPSISELLPRLRTLVESLTIRDRLPQIELAIGDGAQGAVHVLVFRVLEPPSESDVRRLVAFAEDHGVHVWLQPKGPATAAPLHPPDSALAYELPEFDISVAFGPTDFTQVNPFINRALVRRAMQLLDPQPGELIADFFCGLGNFTLPIARLGAQVTGIEGAEALVARAQQNAKRNGLADTTRFVVANLFDTTPESLASLLPLDKALVDPPREGAVELARSVPRAEVEGALQRLVYVSCNPATLARDAAVLVHDRGYTLQAAGVVNMFPHTAHVESMALFTR